MTKIIDAHHHLWRYDAKEYAWIAPHMKVLQADFVPEHLEQVLRPAGVDGSIVVQARQSIEETEWLLDLAEGSNRILGVVGWLPLASPELPALLERFAGRPRLKGLRHLVQDEPDPEFILGERFNAGIESIRGTGLVYDILVHADQLPQTIEFVRRHPDQSFVLDHCGKPTITDGCFEAWRSNLELLGKHENVTCKVSGLPTQVCGGTWDLASLTPYLDAALSAFGPRRLMAGSDWPVCLLASTYLQWWSALCEWATVLDDQEREDFFCNTARRVYKLN
jgi:L-fuconolactonase